MYKLPFEWGHTTPVIMKQCRRFKSHGGVDEAVCILNSGGNDSDDQEERYMNILSYRNNFTPSHGL